MITTLVGAQYGSEGKGLIAGALADEFDVHVRTGAPNAGHTYYVNDPRPLNEAFLAGAPDDIINEGIISEQIRRERVKVVARSIPCGAANPEAILIIGPGGLIDVALLENEIHELLDVGIDVRDRLYIDGRCGTIHPEWHHKFEGGVEGAAHQLIGSTGEGVGPARMARIARGTVTAPWAFFQQAQHIEGWKEMGVIITDTSRMLHSALVAKQKVLLEGTQGCGLSLITGEWPFVTSTDTNTAQLCADAGVSPRWVDRCILVARTYPIRVAGNSGPLRFETTWEEIGVPEEHTTVTKKVRRVGAWDHALVNQALRVNYPAEVAITFLDYVFPDEANKTDPDDLSLEAKDWIGAQEYYNNMKVTMVGTGPDSLVRL